MNEPASSSPTPALRASRWTRIALVISLALNLAVIGVAAGTLLRPEPEPKRGNKDGRIAREFGLGPFARALTKEDRAIIRGQIGKTRGNYKANRGKLRAILTETFDVIRAPELDVARLEALFAAQRDIIGSAQITGQKLLIERLKSMSAKERSAFAERAEADMLRGRSKKKRD